MTTFETLSLLAQFSLSIIAILTLVVAIVVFLEEPKAQALVQRRTNWKSSDEIKETQ